MNTFSRDMAIERIEDFKYLSARVNTIMSEYMDREEYFVKDKDLFEKWLANRPTLHIHYLDSNENIRMEIDHTIGLQVSFRLIPVCGSMNARWAFH